MRAIRILLIFVVILGVLFVAADRIALTFAESEAATKAQQTQGLSSKPKVSIKGFPFLTQVAQHKLDDVQVTADGIEAGTGSQTLRIARFSADLRDVRLSSDFRSAVADTASGSALVTYADLTKAAPSGVTVSYGGPGSNGKGQVKVTAGVTLPVLGTVRRSVVSQISVTGGNTIQLRADAVPGADTIPGLEDLVRQKIDFTRKLLGLPEGITLQSIETTPEGIKIAATGTKVPLAG
jgi:hypothetical protein